MGEWVSVKERLPDRPGKYLIACMKHERYREISTAMFGTRYFVMTGHRTHWKITHWMPLPEPQKEG